MGARAFVGQFGHGKTLGMVDWLESGLELECVAATNFDYIHGQAFSNLAQLAAIILRYQLVAYRERPWLRIGIDEPAMLFPCGGNRFPPVLNAICNRARHYKVELAYAVPNLSRVDLNLRLATSRVVICRGHWYKTIGHDALGEITRPRWVSFSEHEFDADKLGDRLSRRRRLWSSLEPLTALYDSFSTSGAEIAALEALATVEDDALPDWGMGGTVPLPGAPTGSRRAKARKQARAGVVLGSST